MLTTMPLLCDILGKVPIICVFIQFVRLGQISTSKSILKLSKFVLCSGKVIICGVIPVKGLPVMAESTVW